ncbi:hypothetical protein Tco_0673996 [Tanacetum coccineum]
MNMKAAGMDDESLMKKTKALRLKLSKGLKRTSEKIRTKDYVSKKQQVMNIWKNKEKWIIKTWTFYENCGVHILALEDGTKIHMLAERRYPHIRETLKRMMELRLTTDAEGRTKKIMETINVKFDELTAMASEHNCLEPELQRFINHNSSAEEMNTPSKEDFDNLFGPMFEE